MSTLPLLVVEHEAQCPPGWMGEWLRRGRVDARRTPSVRRRRAAPPTSTGHAGLVVLGGEMGAYDDATSPWLAEARRLVAGGASRTATRCSASAWATSWSRSRSAARSACNPRGQQIGVLDVGWTEAAADDPLLGRSAARPTARRAVEQRRRDRAARRARSTWPARPTASCRRRGSRPRSGACSGTPRPARRSSARGPTTTATTPSSAGSTWTPTSPTWRPPGTGSRATWRLLADAVRAPSPRPGRGRGGAGP